MLCRHLKHRNDNLKRNEKARLLNADALRRVAGGQLKAELKHQAEAQLIARLLNADA